MLEFHFEEGLSLSVMGGGGKCHLDPKYKEWYVYLG